MNGVENDLTQGIRTWLLMGEARILLDRSVEQLVAWGKSRCGPPAFNFSSYHGADAGCVAALATARTLPMMADLRVVVVKDIEQADDAFWAALFAYIEEPSPSTLLIASGASYPKVKKGGSNWSARFSALLKKVETVRKVDVGLVPPATFARQQAALLGKDLGQLEAQLLVELVGQDLGRIAMEVEKIALYAGDAKVLGAEALNAACSVLAEADRWDLTTGIAARDARLALAALYRLLEEGEAPHALLAQVMWQLRIVLQVSELVVQGRSDGDIRGALAGTGVRSEIVPRIRAGLGEKPAGSAATLEKVARANRAMNRHRAGDRHVFEALVLDLCQ